MANNIKTQKIEINKEANDIINTNFSGKISLIKSSKLIELFDEGLITNKMAKFLRKVKKLYTKSEKNEIKLKIIYKLDESEESDKEKTDDKEKIDDKEKTDDKEKIDKDEIDYSDEYSPDSPRYDDRGNPLPYDDIYQGKYKDIKMSKYIIPHRKAFVNFINDGFYKEILKLNANQKPHGPDNLKNNIYQILVKEISFHRNTL